MLPWQGHGGEFANFIVLPRRHLKNEKYILNGRIIKLEAIYKMNIRYVSVGINEFKKGYEHKIKLVKDEKGGLLADCHSILSGWNDNVCC